MTSSGLGSSSHSVWKGGLSMAKKDKGKGQEKKDKKGKKEKKEK